MATKGKSEIMKKTQAKDLAPKDSAAVLGGAIVAVNGGGNTPNGSAVMSDDVVISRYSSL